MPLPPLERRLSILEKISALVKLGRAVVSGLLCLVTYPLTPSSIKQPTLVLELFRIVSKKLATLATPRQIQWLFPSGSKAYKMWMSREKGKEKLKEVPVEPFTEELDDGGKLHWIGRRDARKVILHLHSGGYAVPLHDGHFGFSSYLREEVLRKKGVHVKVAFLEYTLIPAATYPTQFHQAVTAIKHILAQGISPSDIIIFGDSAGGMLTVQILSHLLHSHPAVPSLHISTPFAGFLLMSPWLDFDFDTLSFEENRDKDVLDGPLLSPWADFMKQGTTRNGLTAQSEQNWVEPAKAPHQWWNGSEKFVKRVMLIYAGREALKDGILRFGKKFQEGTEVGKVDVRILEDKEAIHIAPVVDAMLRREPGEMAHILAGWTCEVLGS